MSKTVSVFSHWKSIMASMSMGMGSAAIGSVFAVAAIIIPDLNLTSSQSSWMAGGVSIAMLIGALCGGPLIDRFGRKATAVFACLPFVVGWIVIAATRNLNVMQVGRIITGLCAGVINVAVPVYSSEVAEKSVRGLIGSVHELFLNIGLLYTYAFGMIFHWNYLSVACAVLPTAMVASLIWMPESPRWSVAHGRRDEALDALHWLRPPSFSETSGTGKSAVETEMAEIEDNIRGQSVLDFRWTEFSRPKLYKPLLIVFGLMFLQEVSGFTAVVEFTVSILSSATGGTGFRLDPHVQTTIVGLMGVVANGISAVVVDRAGRRMMLTLSAVGMTVGMTGIAVFFTLKSEELAWIDRIGWMPTVSMMLFVFSVALGYGPVPFYLASELFPLRARGVAGGLAMASVCLSTFIGAITFPYMLDALHPQGAYWVFVGLCVVAVAFVLVVPETKGRSLEDIEKIFS